MLAKVDPSETALPEEPNHLIFAETRIHVEFLSSAYVESFLMLDIA